MFAYAAVVIPVHQSYLVRDNRLSILFVIGITAEEHIIPNNRFKAVCFTEGFHKSKMLLHNIPPILKPVFIQIAPAPQIIGFVHPNVDNISGESFAQRCNHPCK